MDLAFRCSCRVCRRSSGCVVGYGSEGVRSVCPQGVRSGARDGTPPYRAVSRVAAVGQAAARGASPQRRDPVRLAPEPPAGTDGAHFPDRSPVFIADSALKCYGEVMEMAVYIAIRRDLKMRRGKEIAQGVHAVAKLGYVEGAPVVVVQVADGVALSGLATEAGQHGVPSAVTRDAGKTEVAAGTMTAIAIGPVEKGRLPKLSAAELY
jgi:PTH2 family peptidyl-tRNA hydrolase